MQKALLRGAPFCSGPCTRSALRGWSTKTRCPSAEAKLLALQQPCWPSCPFQGGLIRGAGGRQGWAHPSSLPSLGGGGASTPGPPPGSASVQWVTGGAAWLRGLVGPQGLFPGVCSVSRPPVEPQPRRRRREGLETGFSPCVRGPRGLLSSCPLAKSLQRPSAVCVPCLPTRRWPLRRHFRRGAASPW